MAEKYIAYVGTYTHENSVGIHLYDMNLDTGVMTERKVVPINNPSDLIVSNNKKYLYSIADEGVEAFKILPDGDLEPINKAWIGGMRGCYVETDEQDRFLFVGGYHDGRVTMMRLNTEDGSIEGIADGIFHKGMGRSVAARNFLPHVTCVKMSPDQQFLCAVDSGIDQVKIYEPDFEKGKLILVDALRLDMESGPRMIRFSRDGKFAYVLCEITNTVEVFTYEYDGKLPVFEKVQSVKSTAEKDDQGVCAASGMEISRDGEYMIVTNAGINCATVFKIDKESGQLVPFAENYISGDYPKVLSIYPNNKFFMCLNNDTNEITTFRIDYNNAYILMEAKPIKINHPNCVYIHKYEE